MHFMIFPATLVQVHILTPTPLHWPNREFCMVVLAGEYVTTYLWRPGEPTRFKVNRSQDVLSMSVMYNQVPKLKYYICVSEKVLMEAGFLGT